MRFPEKSIPEIKPIIENLQDELYQLDKNERKVLNFVLT